MKKNKHIILVFLLASLAIMAYWSWQSRQINNALTHTNFCYLKKNQCTFTQNNQILSVKFDQAPQVETELLINFTLANDVNIHQAWIEGLNMYMGNIPILFETTPNDSNTVQGVTFLGSCTQSQMQWKMTLILQHKKTESLQEYSVLFNTTTH